MPSTMQHHSRTRAQQAAPRILVAGDLLSVEWTSWLSGLDLVRIGDAGEDVARYRWTERLLAQLNTDWVPSCIVLQDNVNDISGLPSGVGQPEYNAHWQALVDAAHTSSARVIVLVEPAAADSTTWWMLYGLTGVEWLDIPSHSGGWDTATQQAQASRISSLIFNT